MEGFKKNNYLHINRNNAIAFCFVIYMCMGMLETVLESIVDSRVNALVFNVLRTIIVAWILFLSVQRKNTILKLIVVLMAIILLYSCSFVVNPRLLIMSRTVVVNFVGITIPAVAFGMCIKRDEGERILYYCRTVFPLVYVYVLYNILFQDLAYVYQNVAYAVLFFAMIAITLFFRDKNWGMLVHYIILTVLLVYLGSRGPVLCLALWTVILIYYTDKTKLRMNLTCFGIIGVVLLYLMFWKDFIEWLYGVFPQTRIIAMLYKGNFFESGRSILYSVCLDELKNRIWDFGGIMSDRFFLVDNYKETSNLGFYVAKDAYQSVYTHNICLELCFCFGVVIGTMIVIALCGGIIRLLKKIWRTPDFYFVTCIIIMGSVPLLFSNSYLSSTYFWVLVGMILSI